MLDIMKFDSLKENLEYTPGQVLSTVFDVAKKCSVITVGKLSRVVDASEPSFTKRDFRQMLLMLNHFRIEREGISKDKSIRDFWNEERLLMNLMRYAYGNSIVYERGSGN